jgi:signal transduction histidine kinase
VRGDAGELTGMIVLNRTGTLASRTMWLNTLFLFAAGCVALGLAILVFYLITTRIILSPVRALRDTAEAVQQGNLDTRSDIQTGDEFEDLAETFNQMVQELAERQRQLRTINFSLEEKANELAERNVELFEAARVKDEFLASVTHELRTPMNSVLGFAELLEEQTNRDDRPDYDAGRLAKRRRYLENILSEGRRLLELINGLLEMAKMEAGKAELNLRAVDLRTLAETQLALMRPMADKRSVELRLEAPADLPTIITDAGKLQQVLFNLLSNAVKFTADASDEARASAMARDALDSRGGGDPAPRLALVTFRVEHLLARAAPSEQRVRLSVLDTGPGIAPVDQKRIFEKFTQLDSGITRRHAGTGLGLYICKQLTTLLQGEIIVESDAGRGAMFSVLLPIAIEKSAAVKPVMAAV